MKVPFLLRKYRFCNENAVSVTKTRLQIKKKAFRLMSNGIGLFNSVSETKPIMPETPPPARTAPARDNTSSKSGNAAAGSGKKATQLGDFRLRKRLGKGGMGEVFLAQQVSLDRPVAIKTLSKELAKKPDFVERFLREARSMARLHHPNIVQVYAADSHKGINYVAIEYIDGCSMQNWMDQLKRLSVADSLHIVLSPRKRSSRLMIST